MGDARRVEPVGEPGGPGPVDPSDEPDASADLERSVGANRGGEAGVDGSGGVGVDASHEPGAHRTPKPVIPDEGLGGSLIIASWVGTAIYTLVAVADLVAVRTFVLPVIVVTSVLFVLGLVAFMAAYAIAVSRSREVLIGMGGLFFLSGTAPRRVQRHLVGSFAAQAAVATVTASIGVALVPADATNPLAFGFLVPMYGLGLAGLWGARFGVFAPRTDKGPRVRD
jgi:hypothetical protein